MPEQRVKTNLQGVYKRVSSTRRNHLDGKADICFDITYKMDGKKVWEKVGWKSEGYTAQFAHGLRAERLQAVRHGEPIRDKERQAQGLTFGAAWDIYREKWLPNIATPDHEHRRYEKHIAPHLADKLLNDIKPLDLESFKQHLGRNGLSPKTVTHVLSLVRSVYKKMSEWELYDGRIPTTSLKMPKVDNGRIRYLTKDEAEKIISELKTRPSNWWQIATVSLGAGLRLGEILKLTWGDLDLEAGVIHVRFGKTGVRMAYMNSAVKALFRNWPAGPKSEPVFQSASGRQMHSCNVSEAFTSVVNKLGLNDGVTDERQKVVFYTLRHTFASWLVIRGVAIYTVAELMGHSTVEMTKRYAHLSPATQRAAVMELDLIANGD